MSSTKFHSLESIRGSAAWFVLFGHFALAFLPGAMDPNKAAVSSSLVGTPLYFLFNGPAAVSVFFVLSGYVLTCRYFETPDARAILVSMLKRWPRLAGPVLVVVLLAMGLFAGQVYSNLEAAALADSPWLRRHARTPVDAAFQPSWSDAVFDATIHTFFVGSSRYNTNLWTIRYELFGSYLAWTLAVVVVALRKRVSACIALAIATAWSAWVSSVYAAFSAGVALAYLHSLQGLPRLGPRASKMLVLLALGLLSLQGPHGWLEFLKPYDLPWYRIRPLAYVVGALLLIHAFRFDPWLVRQTSGPVGRWLGRLSFPVYLVHTLVLTTISSSLYVSLRQAGMDHLAVGLTFAVTVAVVLAASIPLVWFDEWWTRLVTRRTAAAVDRLASFIDKPDRHLATPGT